MRFFNIGTAPLSLLIKQLKPEADEISDAARLVSFGQFGEAQAKVSEAIKRLEGAKLEQPLRLLGNHT